jgi:RNA polymerase sigma factor (sigma-70 family)
VESSPPPGSPTVETPAATGLERELLRCLPRLRAYLARRGSPGEAGPEDLAQEAAVRVLTYRGSYQPDRPLWPWLRQVADRVRFDHLRKRDRASGDLEREAERASETRAPGGHLPLEVREDLERALRPLKPAERDLLLRFHGHGQSIAEIAAATGRPAGTVKSDLWRARRKLAAAPNVNDEGASR